MSEGLAIGLILVIYLVGIRVAYRNMVKREVWSPFIEDYASTRDISRPSDPDHSYNCAYLSLFWPIWLTGWLLKWPVRLLFR